MIRHSSIHTISYNKIRKRSVIGIVLCIQCSLFCLNVEVICAQGLHLWRNSASVVNDEMYKGFHKGNSEGKVNEILAGWLACCLLQR